MNPEFPAKGLTQETNLLKFFLSFNERKSLLLSKWAVSSPAKSHSCSVKNKKKFTLNATTFLSICN